MSGPLEARVAARRQAEVVAALRALRRPPGGANAADGSTGENAEVELCDLCGKRLDRDHRHLLHLVDRRILCACESCLALRGGDPELRPTGTRTVWLDDFDLPDETWSALDVPIGVAFFIDSSATGGVVALYPSPAGATESAVPAATWRELRTANPVLMGLESDAEALIANRIADPPQYAIVPIDECYRLVGLIKISWEGISGGDGPERAVADFFAELRERAAQANPREPAR
jgi:Family of unknown function (DUF5947)